MLWLLPDQPHGIPFNNLFSLLPEFLPLGFNLLVFSLCRVPLFPIDVSLFRVTSGNPFLSDYRGFDITP
jgi:hypothetical protein